MKSGRDFAQLFHTIFFKISEPNMWHKTAESWDIFPNPKWSVSKIMKLEKN